MPPLDKSALRTALAERRDALSTFERTEIEHAILARITSLSAWQNAPVVCGYISTRGELDLSSVWQTAVASGKTYALPVTLTGAADGQMIFRAVPDFCPDRLVRARFGIAEPPDAADFPTLPLRDLRGALILVPGLGFDRDGYRIGYGGGYYDRFLAALATENIPVTTVGLCPSVCHIPELPHEAHDRPVDLVIDEF